MKIMMPQQKEKGKKEHPTEQHETLKEALGNAFTLDDLSINTKERAIARARYKPFARYCYWLLVKSSEGDEIFYPNDLCKFAKITYYTSYRFFNDLVNFGYADKVGTGNLIYFKLSTNNNHIKLQELLPYLKKTLQAK